LSKNENRLFSTHSILYSSLEIIPSAVCADETHPMCVLVLFVDSRIPLTDFAIRPRAYFYEQIVVPTAQTCDLVDDIDRIPRAGFNTVCSLHRKPLETSNMATRPNPFMAGTQTFDTVAADANSWMTDFILLGPVFNGIIIQRPLSVPYQDPVTGFSMRKPRYTRPIARLDWDDKTCGDSSSPVCVGYYYLYYQGPHLRVTFSAPPFASIDYSYCFNPNTSSKSLVYITGHSINISDLSTSIPPIDPTNLYVPFKCAIGYYKNFRTKWTYTTADHLEILGHHESGAIRNHAYSGLLPASKLPIVDVGEVVTEYDDIPILYTHGDDCLDPISDQCSITLKVPYDPNTPSNYIRSFDVYLPFTEHDEIYLYNQWSWTVSGFATATVDVSVDTYAHTETKVDHVYFHVSITHRENGAALHGPNNQSGAELYESDLVHSISIVTRKDTQVESFDFDIRPLILTWNSLAIDSAPGFPSNGVVTIPTGTNQPSDLLALPPYRPVFEPSMKFDISETCQDIRIAYCIITFKRSQLLNRYVYIYTPDQSLTILLEMAYSTGYTPVIFESDKGNSIIQVDLALLFGDDDFFLNDIIRIPLQKPYGLTLEPQLIVAEIVVDPVTFLPIVDPVTNKIEEIRSYDNRFKVDYRLDFFPEFHSDCNNFAVSWCTITWTSNTPLILNALDEPIIIMKHLIPDWYPDAPPLPTEEQKADPEFMAELAFSRLMYDWGEIPATVKEIVSFPDLSNYRTFYLKTFLDDQTQLYPQMSLASFNKWKEDGFSFAPDSDLLPQPGTAPKSPHIPAHVEPGQAYSWTELEYDTATGKTSIMLKIALQPSIVLKPGAVDASDQANWDIPKCVLNGIFAPFTEPPVSSPLPPTVKAAVPDVPIKFSTELSLWYGTISPRLFIRADVVLSYLPLQRETMPPVAIHPMGYTPITIVADDNCAESWKSGRLLCTFAITIWGSPEHPIDNVTYLAPFKLPTDPMIRNGRTPAFKERVHPDDYLTTTVEQNMTLLLDRDNLLCSLISDPKYRYQINTAYMTFTDEFHGTPRGLLSQRPKLLPQVDSPVYQNLNWTLETAFDDISALLTMDMLVAHAFPPYEFVSGQGAALLAVPAMMTGPLIKIVTIVTRYNADVVREQGGMVPIRYMFNSIFDKKIQIDTVFSQHAIPCIAFENIDEIGIDFSTSDDAGNYRFIGDALEIDEFAKYVPHTSWSKILAEVEEYIAKYATQQKISIQQAYKTIKIEHLPNLFTEITTILAANKLKIKPTVAAWVYPSTMGLGGETAHTTPQYSWLTTTSPDNLIPLYSTCSWYMPLTKHFPTKWDSIKHAYTAIGGSITEFLDPSMGDPTEIFMPTGKIELITYPYAVTSSTIKPVDKTEEVIADNSSPIPKISGLVFLAFFLLACVGM
jgi:hypothetical protein